MSQFFTPQLVSRIVALANADEESAPLFCEFERAWWEADDSPLNAAVESAWAEWEAVAERVFEKYPTSKEFLDVQTVTGSLVAQMQHAAFICGLVAGNPGALVVSGMLGEVKPKRGMGKKKTKN